MRSAKKSPSPCRAPLPGSYSSNMLSFYSAIFAFVALSGPPSQHATSPRHAAPLLNGAPSLTETLLVPLAAPAAVPDGAAPAPKPKGPSVFTGPVGGSKLNANDRVIGRRRTVAAPRRPLHQRALRRRLRRRQSRRPRHRRSRRRARAASSASSRWRVAAAAPRAAKTKSLATRRRLM